MGNHEIECEHCGRDTRGLGAPCDGERCLRDKPEAKVDPDPDLGPDVVAEARDLIQRATSNPSMAPWIMVPAWAPNGGLLVKLCDEVERLLATLADVEAERRRAANRLRDAGLEPR